MILVLSLSIWSAVLRTFVVKVRDKKGKKRSPNALVIWYGCIAAQLAEIVYEGVFKLLCTFIFIHYFEVKVNGTKFASWFEFK